MPFFSISPKTRRQGNFQTGVINVPVPMLGKDFFVKLSVTNVVDPNSVAVLTVDDSSDGITWRGLINFQYRADGLTSPDADASSTVFIDSLRAKLRANGSITGDFNLEATGSTTPI